MLKAKLKGIMSNVRTVDTIKSTTLSFRGPDLCIARTVRSMSPKEAKEGGGRRPENPVRAP